MIAKNDTTITLRLFMSIIKQLIIMLCGNYLSNMLYGQARHRISDLVVMPLKSLLGTWFQLNQAIGIFLAEVLVIKSFVFD